MTKAMMRKVMMRMMRIYVPIHIHSIISPRSMISNRSSSDGRYRAEAALSPWPHALLLLVLVKEEEQVAGSAKAERTAPQ